MPQVDTLRYSVVVPVHNEARNIGAFCAAARAALTGAHEVLFCHDDDSDDTLPALAALPAEAKPACVRLVHNQLGPGVRFALEAGMRAARAPVVVVTMADLSDDLADVDALVRAIEDGATIACGSRYMEGGRQLGGPRFKGALSRLAGLSLRALTGLPTHDPTNSFKAYDAAFVQSSTIESREGFVLGFELTVKAYLQGLRVTEVPTTWRDRVAGESRFRLRRWIPLYLRWYLWAVRQSAPRLAGWRGRARSSGRRQPPSRPA